MSTALTRLDNLDQALTLATRLSKTKMIPVAFQGKPDETLAIILKGAELGLPPMSALGNVTMINGKAGLSAEIMAALVKARRDVCKLFQLVEDGSTGKATYEYQRDGMPTPKKFSYTKEQAQTAGLWGANNWGKHPAAMLRARCVSALCRAEFSDVINGVYETTSGEFAEAVGQARVEPLPSSAPALPPPTDAIQVKAEALLERVEASQAPSIPILDHDPDTGEVLEEPEAEPDIDAGMTEQQYWETKVESAKTRSAALGVMSQAPGNLKSALSAVYNRRWAARAGR